MINHKPLRAALAGLSFILLLLVILEGSLSAAGTKYTCPMHPHYISDTFGTCPICGMDLVEMEAVADVKGEEEQGLHLPNHMVQRTGVRSRPVEIAYFGRSIRSFGEVAANQRLQTDVSLRVEGWIEELVANAEGDEIQRHSLLFRFYSPLLVSAQQDYLAALASGNKGRIRVTEDRLSSLGVQKNVIGKIRSSGKLIRSLPYYAQQTGRVEDIGIRQGSYLRAGALAMRIQGYEKVWIQVNLAEQDISFISKQSRVDVEFPNLGIHREKVAIDYIAPVVDPATRTAQLRLILDNPDGRIRPGAYANVMIMTDISPRPAVPYESILLNKDGHYVIVERSDGTYQAREIKLGMQYRGLVEVQAGLQVGELVVVSAQFLIDSESSLRESFKRMEKLALSLAELEITEQQLVLLNHMSEGALYVHEELLAGRVPRHQVLDGAEQAARKLDHELQGSRLVFVVEDFLAALKNRAEIMTLSGWQKLLAESVKALIPWIAEGRPLYYKELGLALFTTGDDRSWLQFSGDMMNPYGSVKASEIPLTESDVKRPEELRHAK